MAEGDIQKLACATCGRSNPPQNRFCGFCGASLPEVAPVTEKIIRQSVPAPIAPSAPPPAVAAAPAPSPDAKKQADELTALLAAQAALQTPKPTVKPVAPAMRPTPVPPAVPRPKATPHPVELLPVPTDGIARERERDKLLTQANAFRVKGQVTDARETLQKALPFFEGRPPQEIAPIHEQIGDLLEIEEFDEDAMTAYEAAFTLDPRRISADRKRAALALALANRRNPNMISAALLRGEDLSSILSEGAPVTRRNAGLAMFLSVVFPGFGQLYNAQIIKGGILMAVAVLSLFVISASGDRDALFHNIAALFALRKGGAVPSPVTIFFCLSYLIAWIYSIVDAPFFAGKGETATPVNNNVDKSGWEV